MRDGDSAGVRKDQGSEKTTQGDCRVKLVPVDETHKELLYAWRILPQVAAYMIENPPDNYDRHQEWFNHAINEEDRRMFVIEASDRLIGFAQLTYLFNDVEFGFYIADVTQHKRGIGREVLRQLTEIVFERFSLEELHCRVICKNSRALKLYLNFGFKVVGANLGKVWLVLRRGDYLLEQAKNTAS